MKVTIDIDVTNPEEVIKAHKGELLGFVAGVLLNQEKKKTKIEKKICEELIRTLEVELPKALKREMVEAKIGFSTSD